MVLGRQFTDFIILKAPSGTYTHFVVVNIVVLSRNNNRQLFKKHVKVVCHY